MGRYGAGTVFQRPDGTWIAQWERPPLAGKRRRGTRVGRTAAEAQRRMVEAQRAEASPSRSRRRTGSVGAFLDEWLADVVAPSRRERTYHGYRAIRAALPASVTELDLASPRLPGAIARFLGSLERHPRTVAHYAAMLRAAFGWAVKRRIVDHNPAADLSLPAIPRLERIPWSPAERDAFLAAHPEPLWIAAAFTGLRLGELLGLRWEDVDLDRRVLVVRHSLTRLPSSGRGTRYELTEPKTPRSRRTVPLLPVVVESLRTLRKARLAESPVAGAIDQGLVFATPAGSPLDAAAVSRRFRELVEASGLPRIRLHDLRHGFASDLIASGVDLATVGSILGHSNIGTTVDVYGHLTEGHKRAAVERLAGANG